MSSREPLPLSQIERCTDGIARYNLIHSGQRILSMVREITIDRKGDVVAVGASGAEMVVEDSAAAAPVPVAAGSGADSDATASGCSDAGSSRARP